MPGGVELTAGGCGWHQITPLHTAAQPSSTSPEPSAFFSEGLAAAGGGAGSIYADAAAGGSIYGQEAASSIYGQAPAAGASSIYARAPAESTSIYSQQAPAAQGGGEGEPLAVGMPVSDSDEGVSAFAFINDPDIVREEEGTTGASSAFSFIN